MFEDNIENKWHRVEERIGGERGRNIVAALKELYGVFGRSLATRQAELYSPEVGGFYFSNSARDNPTVITRTKSIGFFPT